VPYAPISPATPGPLAGIALAQITAPGWIGVVGIVIGQSWLIATGIALIA
jgi:hypothetical protein